MNTLAEENYLKSIYQLSLNTAIVGTNQIAARLNTKAASVTDMLKKLAEKELINYTRYQGVSLTASGEKIAVHIIRRHRLWEYFLVEKLNFKWDEVHEMAEEMEHISSKELIDRLDEFMDFPRHDPHGDPIPDSNGNFSTTEHQPVAALTVNQSGKISGVKDHSAAFLQYLEKQQLVMGQKISVVEIIAYDHTMVLQTDNKQVSISRHVADNLLIAHE